MSYSLSNVRNRFVSFSGTLYDSIDVKCVVFHFRVSRGPWTSSCISITLCLNKKRESWKTEVSLIR